jgi:hypothetical protein
MTKKILSGHIVQGCGDAVNWPMADILKKVGSCFRHLHPGTLNVKLDANSHTLRPDFKLHRDERSDKAVRHEDLGFECCRLVTEGGSLKALIARTSTNYHGDRVLEIM